MRTDCWLTLQSISEFYVAMTRKRLILGIDGGAGSAQLDWLGHVPNRDQPLPRAVRTALAIAASGRASYWDALLVHTAAEAGCTAILTEDLADGTSSPVSASSTRSASATLSPAAEALLSAD